MNVFSRKNVYFQPFFEPLHFQLSLSSLYFLREFPCSCFSFCPFDVSNVLLSPMLESIPWASIFFKARTIFTVTPSFYRIDSKLSGPVLVFIISRLFILFILSDFLPASLLFCSSFLTQQRAIIASSVSRCLFLTLLLLPRR